MIVNSRVYVYRQNNSGGYITKPAKFIIVEAENEPAALDKAKEAGLYLHGVSLGTCLLYTSPSPRDEA